MMDFKALKKFAGRFQRRGDEFPATLGLSDGTVDVVGRPGYSHALMADLTPVQVWRESMPPVAGLPIIVGMKNGRLTALRIWDTYATPPKVHPIHEHAASHRYMQPNGNLYQGYDWLPVEMRQLMAFRVIVDNTSLEIDVESGMVFLDQQWLRFPGETDIDLTASVPVTGALYVLVSVYNNSGAADISVTVGAAADLDTLTIADIPAVPAGHVPLAAIRLYVGQVFIAESAFNSDIIDLRQFGLSGGTSAPIPDPVWFDGAPISYNDATVYF
jgi:hypothetical protein